MATPSFAMASPSTPKTNEGFIRTVQNFNIRYNLDLPIRNVSTPSTCKESLPEKCLSRLKYLHFKAGDLLAVEKNFDETFKWCMSKWEFKPKQEPGTLPSRPAETSFLHSETMARSMNISMAQRDKLLKHLEEVLSDECWMVKNRVEKNSSAQRPTTVYTPRTPVASEKRVAKRKSVESLEVFCTAPNSPNIEPATVSNSPANVENGPAYTPHGYDGFEDFGDLELDSATVTVTDSYDYDEDQNSLLSSSRKRQLKIKDYFAGIDDPGLNVSFASTVPRTPPRQSTVSEYMKVKKRVDPSPTRLKPPVFTRPQDTSFNTTVTDISNGFSTNTDHTAATSFSTCANDDSFDHFERASQGSAAMFYSTDQLQDFLVPQPSDKSEEKVNKIIYELETSGPFSRKTPCPSNLPLRYVYEIERVSLARGVSMGSMLPNHKPNQDYEELWSSINNQGGRSNIIERTKQSVWDAATDNFDVEKDSAVVTLSGELDWCQKSQSGFMSLKLNPLKFERSHRFARRFGSDRFLEITFPSLSRMEKENSHISPEAFKPAFAKWLCTSRHYLLGRVWRGFFVEDVKKKRKDSTGFKCKVFLFAVDGYDFVPTPSPAVSPIHQPSNRHTPMSINSLVDWHMPFEDNKQQPDCKLFNRISLGLSRTLATVTLLAEEILEVRDPEGTDMSDGCALMSKSLAEQVSQELKLNSYVSCFQGRIAGAKGVWMAARDDTEGPAGKRNFWIQIKRSQLKVLPHPAKRKVLLDDYQLTFEAVSWCRPLHPVNLNTQFLMVLQNNGLRKEYLRDLVREEVRRFYKEFEEAFICNERLDSRHWIQKMGVRVSEDKSRKIKQLDQFPPDTIEQILLLLDSGFLPTQLSFLRNLFKEALKLFYEAFENLKIKIPQSTYAYCVADPYYVLKEDEVHLGFCKAWEDNGYTELDGVDVLVARNPAHLPSDIQRRKAVYKRELSHLKNVIVFPSVGAVPLATYLSGGDYDGDESWVCWDPRIVDSFKNASFRPEDIPKAESFGLVNRSESIANVPFDTFLSKAFLFNLQPNYLGMCTNEHERLCYFLEGIGDESALNMSYLLSHLADTRKSGYELTWPAWKKFREGLGLKGQTLDEPAYKSTEPNGIWNPENIIDYLKFEVVRSEKDWAFRTFDKACRNHPGPRRDQDLIDVFNKVWERAVSEANGVRSNTGEPTGPIDRTLLESLSRIQKSVTAAEDKWLDNAKSSYDSRVSLASELLFSIKPPEFPHPLSYTWLNAPEVWRKLLASCAYRELRNKFPWYAAGFTLCDIKADAAGPHRVVMSEIHNSMRVKARAAKKLDEKNQLSEGSDSDSEGPGEDIDLSPDIFEELDL